MNKNKITTIDIAYASQWMFETIQKISYI